jgi:hypothetical protein
MIFQKVFRLWTRCLVILGLLCGGLLSVEDKSSVSTSNSDNSELLRLLVSVAGIYETRPTPSTYKLDKTVIVTACNYGFLNHLYNFDCFMKRLKMKYLVIAMDLKAYEFLKTNTSIVSYYMSTHDEITTLPQEFRSKQFNLITTRKKEAVLSIMKLGYDVLFSDTDVAVVRDPLPYMIWDNIDYVHSLNAFCKV